MTDGGRCESRVPCASGCVAWTWTAVGYERPGQAKRVDEVVAFVVRWCGFDMPSDGVLASRLLRALGCMHA